MSELSTHVGDGLAWDNGAKKIVASPKYYHGYVAAGASVGAASSQTFIGPIGAGGFIAAGDWTDGLASGITRVDSTFTIDEAGVYKFDVNLPVASTSAYYFGVRLVGSVFGNTVPQETIVNSYNRGGDRAFLVACAAGETVTLQYAKIQGTPFAITDADLNGVAASLGTITIVKL